MTSDKPPLAGNFDLFKDTPVWPLAKAVRINDAWRIEKLIREDSMDINYQEPIYGHTLLSTAIASKNKFSYRANISTINKLLSLGADPNLYGDLEGQTGDNAVTLASSMNYYDALRLLLDYGGNPNSRRRNVDPPNTSNETALMASIRTLYDSDDMRCMQLLVERGADVNARATHDKWTPLGMATRDYRRVLYLLEHGADYNALIEERNEEMLDLPTAMRYSLFPLDSEKYQHKLRVIQWLREHGVDYYSYPIPESALKWIQRNYPDNWEEYAAVY